MFYRIKFDNTIGVILRNSGYGDTSAQLAVWPAGLSGALIKKYKSLGIKPVEAAILGIAAFCSSDESSEHIRPAGLTDEERRNILIAAQFEATKDKSLNGAYAVCENELSRLS